MDNDFYNSLDDLMSDPELLEAPSFDDSFEKQAADLIIKHIDERTNRSDREQRCFNIVLVVIGFLTLLATIAGIVIQVAM